MDNPIIKSNDSAQEALEKIRHIIDTANQTILDLTACQHLKSQMRITDIITKLAMDKNATHYIYGDSFKKMPIVGNGRVTIENLVRIYFDDALKTQEAPTCHCMDYCQCREPDDEHLSCIIKFVLYKGDTIHIRMNMMKNDEGLLQALVLTSEELGLIHHNMFDIKSLAKQYKVVDNSRGLAGTADEQLGNRHYFLSLNRKLKEVADVTYFELDDKPFSCLIEQS